MSYFGIKHGADKKIELYVEILGKDPLGRPHNPNGPAIIERYPDGKVKSVIYCIHGFYHRKYFPALYEYYPSGNIKCAYYYKFGQLHTEAGEECIQWHDNRQIEKISTWFYGARHNTRTAAIKEYTNGTVRTINCIGGGMIPIAFELISQIETTYEILRTTLPRQLADQIMRFYHNLFIEQFQQRTVITDDIKITTIANMVGTCSDFVVPARVETYPNGQIKSRDYIRYGIYHSDHKNTPTRATYKPDGTIETYSFYKYGMEHNEGAPSKILKDGMTIVQFRLAGKYHNIHAPCYNEFSPDSETKIAYAIGGRQFLPSDFHAMFKPKEIVDAFWQILPQPIAEEMVYFFYDDEF
jgi:antitoxin component YwqK of YwqJK toxin-antitoxin module